MVATGRGFQAFLPRPYQAVLVLLSGVLPAFASPNPPAIRYITSLGRVQYSYWLAVDPAGFAYASGRTATVFPPPCTLPVLGPDVSSGPYGFVTKIDPRGGVVWTVCLAFDSGGPIALDSAGGVYVAGDSTVSKLSPNAGRIIYSTTISNANIRALVVDKTGAAYAVGSAQSGLPTTPGAYQATCIVSAINCDDSFVAKLNTLGAVQYATFTNAPGTVNAAAVDSRGNVWLVGNSLLAKLDAAGAHKLFIDSPGGTIGSSDFANRVTIDSQDAAYIVGFEQVINYERFTQTGYIAKFNQSGQKLFITYIGAALIPSGVAVDPAGLIYVSLENAFGGGMAASCGGPLTPSTLTVYNPDASQVVTSALLPANQNYALALDSAGRAYVLGATATSSLALVKIDFATDAGPHLSCVVSAADFSPASLAAGEIITVFGQGFTPGPNLTVTFGAVAVPILYSDSSQINAIVPFSVLARDLVAIHTGDSTIGPFMLPISSASPSLFTIPGSRQILALNQDGSLNSTSNPAAQGSIITLYLNGAGALNPALSDGQLGPLMPPFPLPAGGPVSATVSWNQQLTQSPPVQVLFVGQAPGQVAGLVQVNLRLPKGIPDGHVLIGISVGQYDTSSVGNFVIVGPAA